MITAAIAMTAVQLWVVYEPTKPNGKHIVLLAGDEEYRSEEALPQLGKILSQRHGFKCTVLFSINANGEIDPDEHKNQPGLESLKTADLVVMALRFREWPDDQMRHLDEYVASGKPIIALRTSTHAFDLKQGPYEKYGWQSKTWPGGFGKQVLGETWVSHWGKHKSEATLGVIEEGAKDHPLLRGVTKLFGDSDVYEASPPADATILVRGQVLSGMSPDSPPADYVKKRKDGGMAPVNDPMQPIAWTREYKNEAGTTNKIFCTTLGAASDMKNEGLRRLVVNAVYDHTGLEVPAKAEAGIVGKFAGTFYGFGGFVKGMKPEDYAK